jgi:hypothetical protein
MRELFILIARVVNASAGRAKDSSIKQGGSAGCVTCVAVTGGRGGAGGIVISPRNRGFLT